MSEELAQAGDRASEATVIKGEEVLEEMKAAGVTVTEVDLDEFKALVPGVYTSLGLDEAREALMPYIEAAQQ